MKKIFMLAVVLFGVFSAKAQSEMTLGVKGGLNVTNISNSDLKNKMSFHLGAFAEFRLNDYFAIQPELLYSRQGARDKYEGYKVQYRVNYLKIPILAKFYVLDALCVDLGPELAFALNAKTRYKDGGKTIKNKIKDVNTVAVNFALGLSYNWENFVFSTRYNIGLSNVIDKNKWDGNNKNHVFQLSVGYRFGQSF